MKLFNTLTFSIITVLLFISLSLNSQDLDIGDCKKLINENDSLKQKLLLDSISYSFKQELLINQYEKNQNDLSQEIKIIKSANDNYASKNSTIMSENQKFKKALLSKNKEIDKFMIELQTVENQYQYTYKSNAEYRLSTELLHKTDSVAIYFQGYKGSIARIILISDLSYLDSLNKIDQSTFIDLNIKGFARVTSNGKRKNYVAIDERYKSIINNNELDNGYNNLITSDSHFNKSNTVITFYLFNPEGKKFNPSKLYEFDISFELKYNNGNNIHKIGSATIISKPETKKATIVFDKY